MPPPPPASSHVPMPLYRFADYLLDPRLRKLTRADDEVGVEPRVFDVLVYLVQQRERAVGRDELMAAAWGRVDSSDATLAQAILKARRLLGDDGNAQRAIRTVARFGYQWVLATDELDSSPAVARVAPPSAAIHGQPAIPLPAAAGDHRASTIPAPEAWRWRAHAIAFVLAFIGMAVVWMSLHRDARTVVPMSDTANHVAAVPGLILVAPAQVHSAIAQDSWMRLGLMAMSADALRSLPAHALVPNETVLAAMGRRHSDVPDIVALRTATGATIVVIIDARRDGERWVLEATLNSADGARESVSAEATDAIAAGAALGEQLRGAFGFAPHGEATAAPEVLAIAARMQSAILEGHADRALALSNAMDAAISSAPEVVLLRAKAMNRLGRAEESVTALHALIRHAGTPPPGWLAEGWTTLGYSELVSGRNEVARDDFLHALDAVGNNRVEAGRARRGLGNAQVALGDLDGAEASYLRARLELQGSGDRLLLTHILDDLGSIAGRRGRLDEAISRYRAAAAAAAMLGATEIELGARMNVALAQEESLQHAAALASWHTLLPRIRSISYPAMLRYATVHYADVLAETGAFKQAATVLDGVDTSSAGSVDALEDVRLAALRVRLTLGDTTAVIAGATALGKTGDRDRSMAAAALLLAADCSTGHDRDAHAVTTQLASRLTSAGAAARAEALLALAQWRDHDKDGVGANAGYREALAAVRDSGSPRQLRDVAVAYAMFQLGQGDIDAARTTAALVAPYAADDFSITLLLARIATANRDPAQASLLHRARELAGERASSLPASGVSTAAVATLSPSTTR